MQNTRNTTKKRRIKTTVAIILLVMFFVMDICIIYYGAHALNNLQMWLKSNNIFEQETTKVEKDEVETETKTGKTRNPEQDLKREQEALKEILESSK